MTGVSKERQTIGSIFSGIRERLPLPTQRAINRINRGEDIGDLRESHGQKILSFLRELSRPLSTKENDFVRSVVENVVPEPLHHYNMFSHAIDEAQIRLALSVIGERQEEFGITEMKILQRDTELRIGIAKFCSLPPLYATTYRDRHESQPDRVVWKILGSMERFHPSRDRGELYKMLFKVWCESASEQKAHAIEVIDNEIALIKQRQKEQLEAQKEAKRAGLHFTDKQLYHSRADFRNDLTEFNHAKTFFLLSDVDLIQIARASSKDEVREIVYSKRFSLPRDRGVGRGGRGFPEELEGNPD